MNNDVIFQDILKHTFNTLTWLINEVELIKQVLKQKAISKRTKFSTGFENLCQELYT